MDKTGIVFVIIVTFACLDLSWQDGSVLRSGTRALEFEEGVVSAEGKPCKCMNWRNCHGEINSDVPCEQSYIFVCCVIPKFNMDAEDDIQVIHV